METFATDMEKLDFLTNIDALSGYKKGIALRNVVRRVGCVGVRRVLQSCNLQMIAECGGLGREGHLGPITPCAVPSAGRCW